MAALRVGAGTDPATQCGPMITAKAVAKIEGLVTEAVSRGAKVRTGGAALGGTGNFYLPTVLDNVSADAALAREEIFGPVAAVYRFSDEAQAIHLANDTGYGLAAYVYTSDLKRALRVGRAIE